MIATDKDGNRFIVRYAWADQYPERSRYEEKGFWALQNRARDSVIRYARHFGLDFTWDGGWDMFGSRFRDADGTAYLGPLVIGTWTTPGDEGVCGWRSIARVLG